MLFIISRLPFQKNSRSVSDGDTAGDDADDQKRHVVSFDNDLFNVQTNVIEHNRIVGKGVLLFGQALLEGGLYLIDRPVIGLSDLTLVAVGHHTGRHSAVAFHLIGV